MKTRFLLLIFVLAGMAPTGPAGLWGEEKPASPPNTLVIFPYFSPDPAVEKAYGYALFAVPDLIRESLAKEVRFRLVSDNGPPVAALPERRLERARDLKTDFFLWGYVLRTTAGLKVFHNIMATETGESVHFESEVLPPGEALIDTMEASSRHFADWIVLQLPEKTPLVQTVEKTVVVEKVVERLVEVPFMPTVTMETAFGVLTFAEGFNSVFAGTGLLKLDASFPLKGVTWFQWGASSRLFSVKDSGNQEAAPNLSLDVLYFPVLAFAGLKANLWDVMELGWDLKAGASFLFGRYNGTTVNLMRPSWGTGVSMELFPKFKLSAKAGFEYLATWIDFKGFYLPSFDLTLGLTFDL